MRNRVIVHVCAPNARGTWTQVQTKRFGSRAKAVRWATRLMDAHPTEHTRYRSERGFYCDLRDKRGWTIDIDAPEVIVPSVGEIGYW